MEPLLKVQSVETGETRAKRSIRRELAAGPFLKWAGGKSQLLPTFNRYFPERFNRYFEPFVGGGAVFFHLAARRPSFRSVISDSNEELINCYEMLRDKPQQVIDALNNHRNDKHHFYRVRALDTAGLNAVDRAARLIFLNKTCFNGLYRVNRSGQFNVPFGKYKNPRFVDHVNIMAVSRILAETEILCSPFEKVLARARKDDFVYLDPPYQPLSSTSSFTGYTKGNFGLDDQKRLADSFKSLNRRGCYVMLSNSDTAAIRDLYKGFRIETVFATRAINCNAERRGRISEILVLNY